MNYDESVFKEKTNRRARRIWIIFAALLSANYGADVANHLRGTSYYIIFLTLCWLPVFLLLYVVPAACRFFYYHKMKLHHLCGSLFIINYIYHFLIFMIH